MVPVTTTTSTWRPGRGPPRSLLKLAMAVTGLVFIGYVLLHMYGNLKVFAGQELVRRLRRAPARVRQPILPYAGLLWIIRVVLIVSVVVHAVRRVQAVGARGRAHAARSTC